MRNPLLTDSQAALVGAFLGPALCVVGFVAVVGPAGYLTLGGVGAACFLALVAGCCRW